MAEGWLRADFAEGRRWKRHIGSSPLRKDDWRGESRGLDRLGERGDTDRSDRPSHAPSPPIPIRMFALRTTCDEGWEPPTVGPTPLDSDRLSPRSRRIRIVPGVGPWPESRVDPAFIVGEATSRSGDLPRPGLLMMSNPPQIVRLRRPDGKSGRSPRSPGRAAAQSQERLGRTWLGNPSRGSSD
jgi:hypothetical protein